MKTTRPMGIKLNEAEEDSDEGNGTMRRFLCFMTCFLTLSFLGCATDATTVTTIDPLDVELEENGYVVEMLEFEEPTFDVVITDVRIEVVTRKIFFHYEITDFKSFRHYYFAYGYAKSDFRPFHALSTSENKASGDVTLDLYVDAAHSDEPVTVEMGYFSMSASIWREYRETNSAGFRYRIRTIDERKAIEEDSFYFYNDQATPTDGMVDFALLDEDSAVQSVRFLLRDYTNGLAFVDEVVVTVTEDMRHDGTIVIFDTLFHALTPGIRYQVDVYAAGNDGAYDFDDVHVGLKQMVP